MTNAISVNQVSKSYGEFIAVNQLSLEVKQGSIFGLLGPNGAGKSTTIRMMVNITMPDTGEIRLFGQPMNDKLQERVGYLPEDRGLYKKMKVGEQLAFFAELKSLPRAEAEKRIDKWLERVEMTAWKHKKWEELSKGMQQKIQFVSTILHSPDLVILDEPFSGLDPVSAGLLITGEEACSSPRGVSHGSKRRFPPHFTLSRRGDGIRNPVPDPGPARSFYKRCKRY